MTVLDYLKSIDENVKKLLEEMCGPDAIHGSNKLKFGQNLTNNFDHYNSGDFPLLKHGRFFYDKEKDYDNSNDIRNHNFESLEFPIIHSGVDWNNSLIANHLRIQKYSAFFEEFTVTPQVMFTDGVFRNFGLREWQFDEISNGRVVESWTKAFLETNSDYVDVIEIGNEIWKGYTQEQWAVFQDSFIRAWLAYDKPNRPKLSAQAFPIGQNLITNLSLSDVLPDRHKEHISIANLHTYPIDNNGRFTRDYANTVRPQIDQAVEFCLQYNPNIKLRITETGEESEFAKGYYQWLKEYVSDIPIIEVIHCYNTYRIKDGLFDNLYLQENNQVTDAYNYLLSL